MQCFRDAFETRKQSCISAFSTCMTVPFTKYFRWGCHKKALFTKNARQRWHKEVPLTQYIRWDWHEKAPLLKMLNRDDMKYHF